MNIEHCYCHLRKEVQQHKHATTPKRTKYIFGQKEDACGNTENRQMEKNIVKSMNKKINGLQHHNEFVIFAMPIILVI